MGQDAESINRIFENGAGSIVTKSIGLKPNKGYPNPTFVEMEHGIINAMGLPNPGINDFKCEMDKLKKYNIPLIGSIFGSNPNEFIKLAIKMQKYGANALELNMSCPHAKGYGLEISSDTKLVEKIICHFGTSSLILKKGQLIPINRCCCKRKMKKPWHRVFIETR